MTNSLKIKIGTQEDYQFIIQTQLDMALETEGLELNRSKVEKGVQKMLENPDWGSYFIAENQGENVAVLLRLNEWSDWRNGHVWWIHSLFVVPEMRGQGVYSFMYQSLQKMAQEDEFCAGIRLYVDKRNIKAQKVYEKLGMNGDHYHLYEWLK